MSEENSTVVFLENCYNMTSNEDGSWKETGKTVLMRWILPQAIIDLEEETHDGCKHYLATLEFSARHYDWNAQKLRFGSDKETALDATRKLVEKLAQWPLFTTNRS